MEQDETGNQELGQEIIDQLSQAYQEHQYAVTELGKLEYEQMMHGSKINAAKDHLEVTSSKVEKIMQLVLTGRFKKDHAFLAILTGIIQRQKENPDKYCY